MRPSTSLPAVALAAMLASLATGASAQQATPPTPPPTPPPVNQEAVTPAPSPSAPAVTAPFPLPSGMNAPVPAGGKHAATPTPPPARVGLDGVWEVQIQHPNVTDYTHFKLLQTGNMLTGTYLDAKGKKYPLAGTVDGQSVRMIVTRPDGTTIVIEGRLDGTTDMVGMLTTPKQQTPFTAGYRPKVKWIENVNPAPGGLGGTTGGYTPP